MTLAAVFTEFPDDDTAEEWFIAQHWPDGVRCPHCDCDRVQDDYKHPTRDSVAAGAAGVSALAPVR